MGKTYLEWKTLIDSILTTNDDSAGLISLAELKDLLDDWGVERDAISDDIKKFVLFNSDNYQLHLASHVSMRKELATIKTLMAELEKQDKENK
jgi:predicted DNA-binding protein YlxM (UPF0122 family)